MQKRLVSLLVPLVTILIIVLIAVLWTIPNVQEFRAVEADTDLARRELEQTLIPQRDALAQVDGSEVNDILGELDSIIPVQIDPGLVLGVLEEISSRHELALTRQTFIQRNTASQMLEFSFKLYGTPEQVNNFLLELENIKPILYVLQLNSTSEFDEEGNTLMNADVLVQSPYGTAGVAGNDVVSRAVTDNDRQIYTELQERVDYFNTNLSYKEHDPFSRGKEDPFVE